MAPQWCRVQPTTTTQQIGRAREYILSIRVYPTFRTASHRFASPPKSQLEASKAALASLSDLQVEDHFPVRGG
jgi:hypothetical protein